MTGCATRLQARHWNLVRWIAWVFAAMTFAILITSQQFGVRLIAQEHVVTTFATRILERLSRAVPVIAADSVVTACAMQSMRRLKHVLWIAWNLLHRHRHRHRLLLSLNPSVTIASAQLMASHCERKKE